MILAKMAWTLVGKGLLCGLAAALGASAWSGLWNADRNKKSAIRLLSGGHKGRKAVEKGIKTKMKGKREGEIKEKSEREYWKVPAKGSQEMGGLVGKSRARKG